jgi:pimeloyl-ACP methyl ester carboxylesterase
MSRINPEAMIRSLRALAKRLPAITCATLVVRGERSDVFSDEDAEKVAARVPNARWVKVSNAGHTVQGDNPRGLVDAMRAFFTEVGA